MERQTQNLTSADYVFTEAAPKTDTFNSALACTSPWAISDDKINTERIRPGKLEERRTARRYKLALQVEIRLESGLKEFQPILGRTRDISARGFYFRINQRLSEGMKIEFSIMPPWEATHAFISGQARVIRVEEVSQSGADRVGVGAAIGRYKFGQTESPAG
jgi:hypothetical protein